jgi:ATP-dependent Lon protease
MPSIITKPLPVLPVEEGVVLPHMVVTLAVDSREAISALRASSEDRLLLVVPRRTDGYAKVGTVARVEDSGRLPSGERVAVVRGLHRAIIGSGVPGPGDALWVAYEPASDPDEVGDAATELGRTYRALVENILEARGAESVAEFLRALTHPGQIADTAGYSPDLSFDQKVEILEELDVKARLEKLVAWARETLAEVSLKDRIKNEVSDGMEKQQREFLLRRQMDAIKKELGEDEGDLVEEYRKKIEESGMPEGARREAERELGRLERTGDQSPEHGWIRNYLDWMVQMPWSARSEDDYDIVKARSILDADHTGLDDIKDRIIELLAVRKLRADRGLDEEGGRGSGAIITLVGPPGVGKTSLGESIARAMGRKFARISLGGIHDESEIRGHRRTYVGSMPGRIARALKDAGTSNPVIMLDEIDKLGAGFHGDPASALLEVLDPAQNHAFRDHYLDVDLDLSDVLFIPTGNVAETIPGPLLDRMEVLRLDGYTEDEKIAIAADHLIPRQLNRAGLRAEEVAITEAALRNIVRDHTREAGVRNLEREIARVLRKVATQYASADEGSESTQIDEDAVRRFLGKPKFYFEAAERTAVPGVATGLAVTGFGGDVLFIEATRMDGDSGLTLTGQLGDVMKESAQIALSYVRSHASELELGGDLHEANLHLHVPAGAVPKDGPSAGVAMTSALVSLLSGRPVKSTVGMTGEVTLQGLVLPIGGVKQKVMAAHRAGLKEVILPQRNAADLDDVPDAVLDEVKVHLVSRVTEALDVALEDRAGEEAA